MVMKRKSKVLRKPLRSEKLKLRNVGVLTDIVTANRPLIEMPEKRLFPSFEDMAMSAIAAIQIMAINYLCVTRRSTNPNPTLSTYMLNQMREISYILKLTDRYIGKIDIISAKQKRNTSKLKNVSR